MKPRISEFILVANEQKTGLGTSDSAATFIRENKGEYLGLKTEISFGIGRASAIPWIAYTEFSQSVKNGIYPVYLYFKDYRVLILAFGVSETIQPAILWENAESKQTVQEFFEKKYSKRPDRYGNSLVFKNYDTDALPSEEVLEADLIELIETFKRQFSKVKKSKAKTPKLDFEVTSFQADLKRSGLVYAGNLVSRFSASLLTKPFLILTGLSGSGKTKLAQAFVKWICSDIKQYRIIPVGADWTNREPLLGYPNALKLDEYVEPENGALDLLIKANDNPDLPYFLILDEMNLSHLERYFADFLSAMESGEQISLHSATESFSGVPSKIRIPKNLFIIGTVNIDETTHMFSPKVLDRANTIEFRITLDEMTSFLDQVGEINMKNLKSKGAGMAKNFLDMALDPTVSTGGMENVKTELAKFFVELKKAGAEFGYRSATEILKLIDRLGKIDSSLDEDTKLDIAIIQKLLPKLHGSRRKLAPVLTILANLFLKDSIKPEKENSSIESKIFEVDPEKIKYPISHEKLSRMHKAAIENGFASFAEA